MLYEVHVKPNAKQNQIKRLDDDKLEVWLKAPPVEGKANRMLLKLLRNHFKTNQVEIIKGHKSRDKIINIELNAK